MHNSCLKLLTDEELIELVNKNKYSALKELVVRYSNDLFNFSFRFTYNSKEANDLVKKIFVNIWQEPFAYRKDFKITAYNKLIKNSLRRKINKNLPLNEKNILNSFSKKELLIANLYYFSTLTENECRLIRKNIKNDIFLLEKKFSIL